VDLDLFIADLSLEDPLREEDKRESLVLSTIHSAKGLEWSAVLILDLVEERFPSRHAMTRPEDYEEERRLMYVACTRAKEFLELYVPASVFDKGSGGSLPAVPSPFVRELRPDLYDEWQESYTGGLVKIDRRKNADPDMSGALQRHPLNRYRSVLPQPTKEDADALPEACQEPRPPAAPPSECGYCRHKVFGRGKIVQHLPPDRYRVNFPGIGLKVIMAAYLSMED
jgi:DNA helicase-2/ATP-dependent DNA helicase PcrA